MSDTECDNQSEGGSIDCFQNYSASEVFIQGLAGIVDQVDVESMIRAQKQMLQRFEKTNEMLNNCNALSTGRLKTASADLKKYTTLLVTMKKDLNNIFKRTKQMKERLAHVYPQAYQDACKATVTISPTDSEADKDVKEEEIKKEVPEFASSSSDSPSSKHEDESTSSDTG